jgi:hypothetical protein
MSEMFDANETKLIFHTDIQKIKKGKLGGQFWAV